MTNHPTANQTVEIVLPSGVFATIRKPNMGELMKCMSQSTDHIQIMMALACVSVQLDGAYLSAGQWLEMPCEDFMIINGKLSEMTFGSAKK